MTTSPDIEAMSPSETTPSHQVPARPARRMQRILTVFGVIVFLSWILDFNPLHPVRWAHEIHAAYEHGRAARRAYDARKAAERRQQGNPTTPAHPATPAIPAASTPAR